MGNDRSKPTRKWNGNNHGKRPEEPTYVTLPYDFIPFAVPHNREFPYECTESGSNLPKHNDLSGLSGCIEYEIRPHSDLAIEVRKKWNSDDFFISGSSIRGKVRANAEILSAGYPEFINRTEMLYRDISDKRYQNRLLGTVNSKIGIERSIQVGFLKKKGGDFYVTPAQKIGDKYFTSIKEHRLMQMGLSRKNFSTIYNWEYKYNEFVDLQSKIDSYQKGRRRRELQREMDSKYRKLKTNPGFFPYQRCIFYESTGNRVSKIAVNPNKNITNKGYLFNSTKASSKRSHYIVAEPVKDAKQFEVPQSVINAYNENLKKFRVTDREKDDRIKAFYNIFNGYDELIEASAKADNESDIKEGLIVFFQGKGQKIESIGRTPYFKIPYANQLSKLIGSREKTEIDYADALFGFIPDRQNQESKESDYPIAYKSRIRFSPLDIQGKVQFRKVENLLLMTPSATASGMYLRQPSGEKLTYEDDNIELNGYKYYHVLPEPIVPKIKDEKLKNMVSTREAISCDGISFRGKLFFRNLSEAELGLLLLSLDWREVLASSKYGQLTEKYPDTADKAYELIGGAKPYALARSDRNQACSTR